MNKLIFLSFIVLSIAYACHSSCSCDTGSNVCKQCLLDFIGSKVDTHQRSCPCPPGWYQTEAAQECEYTYAEGLYSSGCAQNCRDYATLEEAKVACNQDPNCHGITWSFSGVGGNSSTDPIGNGHGYQLRSSSVGSQYKPNLENSWIKGVCPDPKPALNPCDFQPKQGTYLSGCIQGCRDFSNLQDAQNACRSDPNCAGIIFSRADIGGGSSTNAFDGVWGYQLRAGNSFVNSPNGENSWLKVQCKGCGYDYADGAYSSGCAQDCRDFATLDEAKIACDADSSCRGITWSFAAVGGGQSTNKCGNGHGYQLRASGGGSYFQPNLENSWIKAQCPEPNHDNDPCDFEAKQGSYLSDCAQDCRDFSTLSAAQQACRQDPSCGGVTFSRREVSGGVATNAFDGNYGFQLRKGSSFIQSSNGENSWRKVGCPRKPFSCARLINTDDQGNDISEYMDACKLEIGLKTKDMKVLTDCHFENINGKSFVVSNVSLDLSNCNFNKACLDAIRTKIQYKNPSNGQYIDLPLKYITEGPSGQKIIKIPLIDIYDLANEQSVNNDQIIQVVNLRIFIGHSDSFVRVHKWNLIVYTNRDQVEIFQIDVDIQETEGCQPGQECIVIADLDTISKVQTNSNFNAVHSAPYEYSVGDIFYAKIKFADPTYTKKLTFISLYFKNDKNKIYNFSSITTNSWDGDGLRISLPLVEPSVGAVIQVNMKINPNNRFLADTNSNEAQTTQTKFTATITEKYVKTSDASNNDGDKASSNILLGVFALLLIITLL